MNIETMLFMLNALLRTISIWLISDHLFLKSEFFL